MAGGAFPLDPISPPCMFCVFENCGMCNIYDSLSMKALVINFLLIISDAFDRCGSDVCSYILPKGVSETTNVRLLGPSVVTRSEVDGKTYDYIVVGGGGGGCPIARTLADAGERVS
eukprot:Blabericola_migrator_1__309@NODE_107_length_14077_cov_92_419629_g95_i0_p12_GENE_NODE_107_length_14077_cov_92_419629_g95_i0NODE_107_length_14077_cov_92_419629_g95_i0_p12_ORF_typecomplete_len116_score7_07GMC_oxred_N/PF00732_19/2_6e05Pyr_redox/PF00070_27/0_0079FAD_binding_2/PF00890_24/0_0059Pyr_redox_2/PF07992_14/0_12DAO/PF01266_24/0_15FAD_oxidored/PF12831_7/0_2GIDA/PF01134_22/0_26_NODE_107_length_14077_cov_92_419629_g95_i059456292